METDPHLQVIIATVALANGVHSSKIDDSLSIGMPSTLSQTEQQAGRASRSPEATGRAVIFVQKSDITKARKFMASMPAPASQQLQPQKKRGKKAPEDMDPAKAELLVETTCLNAARNRRWQNLPLDETDRDCIAAKRPLPCSLCARRANITISFPPSRPFLPFISDSVTGIKTNTNS
ncbi:ATP-dependent DNA helicase RecQ [Mycena venus]|uniref:ATP-dependent DNA helicase RecQ n=1 Tax=Mycena venus TaxID=2733690 RepID=A0A8H7CMA1_9AGAR|nr:ATP-dependent DNA helicase RecQ [Mycena venus]